jgi:hypothetical protein
MHLLLGPFGWNYKPAEKHCWLIFCERKILFQLKKKPNKTDYKPDEQGHYVGFKSLQSSPGHLSLFFVRESGDLAPDNSNSFVAVICTRCLSEDKLVKSALRV